LSWTALDAKKRKPQIYLWFIFTSWILSEAFGRGRGERGIPIDLYIIGK